MQDILQREPLEWLAVVELWPRTAAGIRAAQGTLFVPPGDTLAGCIQRVPWRGHNPDKGHLEGLLHNLHLSREINTLSIALWRALAVYNLKFMEVNFFALKFTEVLKKLWHDLDLYQWPKIRTLTIHTTFRPSISPYFPSYILLIKVKDYWLDTNFWW